MIVDVSDFTDRPYKVPNQEESRDFEAFMTAKEEELLRGILGNELYDLLADALEASGDPTDPYYDLVNGADYIRSDEQYHYKGLKDLLIPAIYSEWLPLGVHKHTNIGHVVNNAPQQSNLIIDQYPFQIESWNRFVAKVGILSNCRYNYMNTFYGYIKTNESDFPTWRFTAPAFKNRFDF